jgi:hypothetical protein
MTVFTAQKGEITISTSLSKPQLSKFSRLAEKIIIDNGSAYLPLEELHGVLFTNSRKNAVAIVNNHNKIIKNYLVRDKVKFKGFAFSAAVRPMGVYLLLEALATLNPSKADLYRESIFLLAYAVGKHPQLAVNSHAQFLELNSKFQEVARELKKRHDRCQLSLWAFRPDEEKHLHHIEAQALHPSLAADPSNLLIISKAVHDRYHHWLSEIGAVANRKTLTKYAEENGYSLQSIA